MASIMEIAQRAKVSKTTVSRVFNNTPGARISQATRQRVMKACEDLDYQPNLTAQALANARTFILGAMFINISNPEISDYVEAGEKVARDAGFHVILCNSRGDAEREKHECHMLRQRGVEGLIVEHVGPAGHLIELDRAGFPLVLTGLSKDAPWIDYVGFDEVAGMREATNALLRTGRRKLVYLGYSPNSPACETRLAGFRKAVQDAGVPDRPERILPIHDPESISESDAATRRLLASPNRPEGIVCYTDHLAAGAYRAATAAGLRIPEDIAIMGYGDFPFGLMGDAPFPSMHLDLARMGREATRLLLKKIERKEDNVSLGSVDILPYVVRRELLGTARM